MQMKDLEQTYHSLFSCPRSEQLKEQWHVEDSSMSRQELERNFEIVLVVETDRMKLKRSANEG
jgi:hypothetical protein